MNSTTCTKPGPAQVAQRHRPRIEERHLDVEQQEDHRDEVELHRLPLARVADRRHAALVRRQLFRRGLLRAEKLRQKDGDEPESDAQPIMKRMESQPCMSVSGSREPGLAACLRACED